MQSHWLGQLKSAIGKSVFFILKHLKSKYRSVLTNTHVKKIALSGNKGIQTRFEEITLDKNYQIFIYRLT